MDSPYNEDQEGEKDMEEEVSYVEPNDGEQLSCIVQRILHTPNSDTHP